MPLIVAISAPPESSMVPDMEPSRLPLIAPVPVSHVPDRVPLTDTVALHSALPAVIVTGTSPVTVPLSVPSVQVASTVTLLLPDPDNSMLRDPLTGMLRELVKEGMKLYAVSRNISPFFRSTPDGVI